MATQKDSPVWIHVLTTGRFFHPSGPFEVTDKTLNDCVNNFNADGIDIAGILSIFPSSLWRQAQQKRAAMATQLAGSNRSKRWVPIFSA